MGEIAVWTVLQEDIEGTKEALEGARFIPPFCNIAVKPASMRITDFTLKK